jgi:hypothetical protein
MPRSPASVRCRCGSWPMSGEERPRRQAPAAGPVRLQTRYADLACADYCPTRTWPRRLPGCGWAFSSPASWLGSPTGTGAGATRSRSPRQNAVAASAGNSDSRRARAPRSASGEAAPPRAIHAATDEAEAQPPVVSSMRARRCLGDSLRISSMTCWRVLAGPAFLIGRGAPRWISASVPSLRAASSSASTSARDLPFLARSCRNAGRLFLGCEVPASNLPRDA